MSFKKNSFVVVTGCCGFIGYSLSEHLITNNISVIGIDNLNDYYSVILKRKRLQRLIDHSQSSDTYFRFGEIDIADKFKLFSFIETLLSDTNYLEIYLL